MRHGRAGLRAESRPDGAGAPNRNSLRQFWLNHPRVAYHYSRRALIDGLHWRDWVRRTRQGPVRLAVELGCEHGERLIQLVQQEYAEQAVGIDRDPSRFANRYEAAGGRVRLMAQDLDELSLPPNSCDLIFALHSLHHYENLEHIMQTAAQALTPDGFFVVETYAGPPRFQWTDDQLRFTAGFLGLMPAHLRRYPSGIEKRAEGRTTVDEVMRVCPGEAAGSNLIVPLFHRYFRVLHQQALGGAIQHLLYSGIIHNFPDHDPATDHLIDCVADLEYALIGRGVLSSDFVLLVGGKRKDIKTNV